MHSSNITIVNRNISYITLMCYNIALFLGCRDQTSIIQQDNVARHTSLKLTILPDSSLSHIHSICRHNYLDYALSSTMTRIKHIEFSPVTVNNTDLYSSSLFTLFAHLMHIRPTTLTTINRTWHLKFSHRYLIIRFVNTVLLLSTTFWTAGARSCDFLLGNKGIHSYNGNMKREGSPTPGTSSVDLVWGLHNKMVTDLGNLIAPSKDDTLNQRWRQFTQHLHRPDLLSSVEINNLKDMFDVFNNLKLKGKINYGEYATVKTILSDLHLIECVDIVTQYEEEMKGHQDYSTKAEKKRKTDATVAKGTLRATLNGEEEQPDTEKTILRSMLQQYNHLRYEIHNSTETTERKIELYNLLTKSHKESLSFVKELMETLNQNGIKPGEMTSGSLYLSFTFHSKNALNKLWKMYLSGELLRILQKGLVTPSLLKECNVKSFKLKIVISKKDYEECLKYKEEQNGEFQKHVQNIKETKAIESGKRKSILELRDKDKTKVDEENTQTLEIEEFKQSSALDLAMSVTKKKIDVGANEKEEQNGEFQKHVQDIKETKAIESGKRKSILELRDKDKTKVDEENTQTLEIEEFKQSSALDLAMSVTKKKIDVGANEKDYGGFPCNTEGDMQEIHSEQRQIYILREENSDENVKSFKDISLYKEKKPVKRRSLWKYMRAKAKGGWEGVRSAFGTAHTLDTAALKHEEEHKTKTFEEEITSISTHYFAKPVRKSLSWEGRAHILDTAAVKQGEEHKTEEITSLSTHYFAKPVRKSLSWEGRAHILDTAAVKQGEEHKTEEITSLSTHYFAKPVRKSLSWEGRAHILDTAAVKQGEEHKTEEITSLSTHYFAKPVRKSLSWEGRAHILDTAAVKQGEEHKTEEITSLSTHYFAKPVRKSLSWEGRAHILDTAAVKQGEEHKTEEITSLSTHYFAKPVRKSLSWEGRAHILDTAAVKQGEEHKTEEITSLSTHYFAKPVRKSLSWEGRAHILDTAAVKQGEEHKTEEITSLSTHYFAKPVRKSLSWEGKQGIHFEEHVKRKGTDNERENVTVMVKVEEEIRKIKDLVLKYWNTENERMAIDRIFNHLGDILLKHRSLEMKISQGHMYGLAKYSTDLRLRDRHAADITCGIGFEIIEQTINKWEEFDRHCYITKATEWVRSRISSDQCKVVNVFGFPGSGKTTILHNAAIYMKQKMGFSVYPISHPTEFIEYCDRNKNQIFILDNLFGEYKLSYIRKYNYLDIISRLGKNTKILTSTDIKLFTELLEEYKLRCELTESSILFLICESSNIMLSDTGFQLSKDDMKSILRCNLEANNVTDVNTLIQSVNWNLANSSVPLLWKVYSLDKTLRENPGVFLNDPIEAIINIFKQIKLQNKHLFCGLALCSVFDLDDGYFSEHGLETYKVQLRDDIMTSLELQSNELQQVRKELEALDGVYISRVGNTFQFLHSLFKNIVIFLCNDASFVLNYASWSFIDFRVRINKTTDEDDKYMLVYDSDDDVQSLVKKFIMELKSEYRRDITRRIAYYPSIDDDMLISCLKRQLVEDEDVNQSMLDALCYECISKMLKCRPRDTQKRDLTTWSGYKFLAMLLQIGADCNTETKSDSSMMHEIVERYGNIPLIKLLLEHGLDINKLDQYKRCVLHYALGDVEMTSFLLSLPSLTCLNQPDCRNRTPLWYAVHDKMPCSWTETFFDYQNIKNRQKIIELYNNKGAIMLDADEWLDERGLTYFSMHC